jgi:hypothetical protein
MNISTGRLKLVAVAAVGVSSLLVGHAAYRGHANDADYNALLAFDPSLRGTAVDSCVTCHRTGNVPDPEKPGSMRRENHCEYCHSVYVAGKGDVSQTLNRFGTDYLSAGRGVEAVRKIADADSDGDGVSNQVELLNGGNPGDPDTNPLPVAPSRVVSLTEMAKLAPVSSQTMLMNTSHSPSGDSYDSFRGFRLHELLQAIGISPSADSIDFISLDGFERTHTLDELKGSWPQGAPVLGLGKAELGSCGWVSYNAKGLDPARPLPDASILLVFEENGSRIAPATIDPKTGKIVGTGPLRLVVPQMHISPPDLSPTADKSCLDKVAPAYHANDKYDRNGGRSNFSIVAVRVNPLPKGTRDPEWQKVADQYIAGEQVVFYGALKGTGVK